MLIASNSSSLVSAILPISSLCTILPSLPSSGTLQSHHTLPPVLGALSILHHHPQTMPRTLPCLFPQLPTPAHHSSTFPFSQEISCSECLPFKLHGYDGTVERVLLEGANEGH